MKPMRASDWDEKKIRFPCFLQPKIDGVRALNLDGNLTGRSLKKHKNRYITQRFSILEMLGFDGEMAAQHECDPDLCRITTSALSTILGEPFVLWHLFDYVTEETITLPYRLRFQALCAAVMALKHSKRYGQLRVIQNVLCENMEQLLATEEVWLDQGYEGAIVRDPEGMYKEGYSTVREGGLLRIKRFVDSEVEVLDILEGEQNNNEAQINELGKQFRSSHQENMVPSGMLGAMMGKLLSDVKYRGEVLFRKGEVIKVGAGKMPHADRVTYFRNPETLIGSVVKFKLFPHGTKDKPRFPTYQGPRASSDM